MLNTEPDFDSHGLGLLVTLVTANIRSLRFCDPKMAALDVLAKMAAHVTNETVLDRILPFVVSAK
jgi:phosphoinositide-3-kinase regulatory subunit 4